MKRRRGFTLIELMTGLIIFGVVMTALVTAFMVLWNFDADAAGYSNSQLGAKEIVFKMAEAFRGATLCQSTDSGCILNSGIQNASTTGCTIYSRNSSGTLVQTTYAINSGQFQMTTGGVTTTLASNATMTLTYYSSSSYYATAMTTFAPSPSSETNLIAVQIAVTVGTGTQTNSYTTLVRLASGP